MYMTLVRLALIFVAVCLYPQCNNKKNINNSNAYLITSPKELNEYWDSTISRINAAYDSCLSIETERRLW